MKNKNWLVALSATAALSALVAATAHADDDRANDDRADDDVVVERDVRVHVRDGGCPRMKVHGMSDAFTVLSSKKGFLGVEITRLTPELRGHFGVSEDAGVMISRIVDDSAASRAGLAVGDILTRVDGQQIEGSWQLTSAVRGKGGEAVDLEYWRSGSLHQTSVILDEKESCAFDFSRYVDSLEDLGERLPELHLRGLQISEEAMEEVMESLRAINWEEHIKNIERIEIDDLDLRMEGLHERLEELEERLQREGHERGEKFEKMHRERLKALEEHQRQRLEAEVRVRQEMFEAKAEARRTRAEHMARAAEARAMAGEASRAQAAASAEARAAMLEAEARAEAEAAEAAALEEGGGVI